MNPQYGFVIYFWRRKGILTYIILLEPLCREPQEHDPGALAPLMESHGRNSYPSKAISDSKKGFFNAKTQ